jgi:hypothetical protein
LLSGAAREFHASRFVFWGPKIAPKLPETVILEIVGERRRKLATSSIANGGWTALDGCLPDEANNQPGGAAQAT